MSSSTNTTTKTVNNKEGLKTTTTTETVLKPETATDTSISAMSRGISQVLSDAQASACEVKLYLLNVDTDSRYEYKSNQLKVALQESFGAGVKIESLEGPKWAAETEVKVILMVGQVKDESKAVKVSAIN